MTHRPEWTSGSQKADWSRTLVSARGRGARSNASGRFERRQVEPFDDGWASDNDDLPPLRTERIPEQSRTAITYNSSPDIPFDRTINPYKGCEHGCVYCYARPNHAWRGLSAGLDFETRIFIKPGLTDALKKDLSKKSYQVAPIMLGGDTDIYQPIERDLKITRSVLEVLEAHNHPVQVITKSALILRDLDILGRMAERNLASAAISLTTLDRKLARTMEPRASAPHRRLQAIQELATMGIPVTVMAAPMIPGLNDNELETLLETAQMAGATRAGYITLRLPLEIAGLFEEWLNAHYPERAAKVMNLMRELHGGDVYSSQFGVRQRGQGPYARLLQDRFNRGVKRLGLNERSSSLRCDLFRPPAQPRRADTQLTLFGDGPDGAAFAQM